MFNDTTYTDVRPALSKLNNRYHLGIYSEGFTKFQMAKLEMDDLLKFFDPKLIIIQRRKLETKVVESLPLGCTVVDDKHEVVEELSTVPNLNSIWLNRRALQAHEYSNTIKSLSELI